MNFILLAGPCQLESEEHAFFIAEELQKIVKKYDNLTFYYKTSFDKANRTSATAPRGLGLEQALPIFDRLRKNLDLKIITDVHEQWHCKALTGFVDALQIPAFLCRQTDLLIAAGMTGLPINVKKGQFLAPWDMKNVAEKIKGTGNTNVWLCERGTSFGYNTLVTDFRGIPIMREFGPVIFDATHSVQQPGGKGNSSGGQREFVPVLARAAAAVGIDGIFLEVHNDPDSAPSDGPNMIPLNNFAELLDQIIVLDRIVKSWQDY